MQIFIIFKIKDSKYPIAGVSDDLNGISYRTGPFRWIDRRVFVDILREPCMITSLPFGRIRVIFYDNSKGHMQTPEQLKTQSIIKTIIRKLPSNATHLVQPLE